MIPLTTIAEKLQTILNGLQAFSQYQFEVQTHGFHLDKISDTQTGKNFIPVFVSTMGGQYNPVPFLKQADYSIPITFYYPVRFKDDFFLLNESLVDVFVGQFITFGTYKARCNISIAQFGEITDLDLKEFKEWVGSIYRKEIEVREPYISMTINLYITTYAPELIWGDDLKLKKVKITYQNEDMVEPSTLLDDTSPICIERADIASCETAPQQVFGETFIKGYPANLGYTKELPLVIKNTSGYHDLLNVCEVTKDIQNLTVEITETIPFKYLVGGELTDKTLTATHTYYVTNYSRRTSYGSAMGFSLTLSDKR